MTGVQSPPFFVGGCHASCDEESVAGSVLTNNEAAASFCM